jgi:hypothetical protein
MKPLQAIRRTISIIALLLLAGGTYAQDDQREHSFQHVPTDVQVPVGNTLAFRVTGVGVQIYVWTLSATDPSQGSWVLKAPHAVLFEQNRELIGIHFGGPSWEGNDGSKVVGSRIGIITVDPSAIPWLSLKAAANTGSGIFSDVTYIQRLNTVGGLAPTTPGTVGQEVLVPYIADYVFYRAS